MIDHFTTLLTRCVDIQNNIKFGSIYQNYTLSIICFHLTVGCVGLSAISKIENTLPLSTLKCYNSFFSVLSRSGLSQYFLSTAKHCKLSLLANITQSSDPMLQELTLQLDFGSKLLQKMINNPTKLPSSMEWLMNPYIPHHKVVPCAPFISES